MATPTKPTNVIPVDNDTKKEEAKTEDIKKKDAESYTEEEYCIHPDGTCFYRSEDDGNLDFAEGTFDSERYDDFVIQIECFRNDWISELKFGTNN